jgi:hypothetical protein
MRPRDALVVLAEPICGGVRRLAPNCQETRAELGWRARGVSPLFAWHLGSGGEHWQSQWHTATLPSGGASPLVTSFSTGAMLVIVAN